MRAEHIIKKQDAAYPKSLLHLANPPEALYVAGNTEALREGIGIIGARKATPYGRKWAKNFAEIAAGQNIAVISGGARGCDTAALEGALEAGGSPVVFLGGGLGTVYPSENTALFERIVSAGGAIVSEHDDETKPAPWMFRARNRLVAALSRSVLVVEAGVPSGTYATCDAALDLGREVWALPGPIDSPRFEGSNRLIWQGATPIISEQAFRESLATLFGESAHQQ